MLIFPWRILPEFLPYRTIGIFLHPIAPPQCQNLAMAENLLVYEVETRSWQWHMAEIQAVGITEDKVVKLMARNIQKLPATTQRSL
ncbi:MAG: hypothetical protein AB4352_19535 [Hormoscilla sp.]